MTLDDRLAALEADLLKLTRRVDLLERLDGLRATGDEAVEGALVALDKRTTWCADWIVQHSIQTLRLYSFLRAAVKASPALWRAWRSTDPPRKKENRRKEGAHEGSTRSTAWPLDHRS
jgi:hypothetical protein